MRVAIALVAAVVIAFFGVNWVNAQDDSPILRCFHNGEVIVASPVPAPEDFRAQIGAVTHAQWTLTTGQRQVLASTAPCIYLVTSPVPGSIGASNP